MEAMAYIPDKSIDCILADLPYRATQNEWDVSLPLDKLWKHYKRIIKDNGVVLLTASQPFATDLIMSQRRFFKYDLVWDKTKGGNFLIAKKMPMRTHENVLVFYKTAPTYNPQKEVRGAVRKKGGGKASDNFGVSPTISRNNEYYPRSVVQFSTGSRKDHYHPTQKPIELLKYLILTYTNKDDLVLDNCMGAGGTGVAAVLTGRQFIGIEQDGAYFRVATRRIKSVDKDLKRIGYPSRFYRLVCGVCNKEFYWKRPDCKYCSQQCRIAAQMERRRLRRLRERQKVCVVCSERFNATRKDTMYCSRKCKKKEYRKRGLLPV